MFPNTLVLFLAAFCYVVSVVDYSGAKECAKIDLSSTKSRTAACDANAQKLSAEFFMVCAGEVQPPSIMTDVAATCTSVQTALQKTAKAPEKSLIGSILVLMNKDVTVHGRRQFVARPIGKDNDVLQGLQLAQQGVTAEPVDRRIVIVVTYVNAPPCLSEKTCKDFVETMRRDKIDVYFVDINEKTGTRLDEKHFVYDSSLLTRRAEHLPIFGQYVADCICQQLFGSSAAPSSGGGAANSSAAGDSPKGLSATDAAPKKGKILIIVLPVVGLIVVVVAIVVVVIYIKKKRAAAKQSDNKSKSSIHSNEKIGGSSQTKKAATPAPGGPAAPEKQADGGGRQRKVDDYLLLSAHTADKSKKA